MVRDDDLLVHPAIELDRLPRPLLAEMARAGQTYRTCRQTLTRAGRTIAAELAGDAVEPYTHYPAGDVYDAETHAQYYFHVHRPVDFGHFHTFLRWQGIPAGVLPAVPAEHWRAGGDDTLSHLVAIGLDHRGDPGRLFTTNRWVTAETWYKGSDVAAMLPRFCIREGGPSVTANRWINAVMTLFRPQIEQLLLARDAVIARHRAGRAVAEALEDRDLEVTSLMEVDIDDHIDRIGMALAGD